MENSSDFKATDQSSVQSRNTELSTDKLKRKKINAIISRENIKNLRKARIAMPEITPHALSR